MSFKGALKVAWRIVKPVAPTLIQGAATMAGVPMVGTYINAALFAQDKADNGTARFDVALGTLAVAAPLVIDQLEKQLGIDIPEEAAAAYTRAQLQATVDLLNACGILPRKGA